MSRVVTVWYGAAEWHEWTTWKRCACGLLMAAKAPTREEAARVIRGKAMDHLGFANAAAGPGSRPENEMTA